MGEVIVITSGKGGVGKTTITANLGIALSKLGKSVIAIDTDIGLRNLDVVMGLENQIVYNLVDVLEGTCRLRQITATPMHTAFAILLKSKKPLPVPVIAQAIAKMVMRTKTILITFRMTPFFTQSRSFINL